MLAINVSIPNLTVARLEQFPSPQLRIQRERPTYVGLIENKPFFIRKPHVVISRQSPFAANVVPKLVATATSLSCRVLATSAFCRPTLKPPSITNRLVAIVHTKPLIAILSQNWLPCMATSLGPWISVMSSLNNLTPKTYPYRIKQRVASCHTAEVISI